MLICPEINAQTSQKWKKKQRVFRARIQWNVAEPIV